ncbi:Mitochondrial import receptor subunit TOM20 -like protein [Collichthys lucidus]|uniref:Mitochondrial import receptor subunit TOM20-like protein n=4 Tax=Percomorphaceae TaxID=1489872 RepID=A0A4U5U3N7_COLLU|nr:Mitochondrial import receptor subunit TOM20 -like protein [Collichthys lucidus]
MAAAITAFSIMEMLHVWVSDENKFIKCRWIDMIKHLIEHEENFRVNGFFNTEVRMKYSAAFPGHISSLDGRLKCFQLQQIRDFSVLIGPCSFYAWCISLAATSQPNVLISLESSRVEDSFIKKQNPNTNPDLTLPQEAFRHRTGSCKLSNGGVLLGPSSCPEPLRQPPDRHRAPEEKTINSPVILLKPTGSPGVMMGGKTSALAAGVCGALFVGYCIYFDRKRRSDPNFKNRLREPKFLETLGALEETSNSLIHEAVSVTVLRAKCRCVTDDLIVCVFVAGRRKMKVAKERAGMAKLPDLKDAEAVQKFFLEEIQLGEELLAQGDYEKGVDHLTNAIAVCGQPQQLLQVLQQTLPPPVFQMLLTKLPSISQRIVSAQSLSEDDIE